MPSVMVSPEMDAVTPLSTWNTRLSPDALTVTPAFGPMIVSRPVVSVSSSWVPARLIVSGALNTVLSKTIASSPRLSSPGRSPAQVGLTRDVRVGGVVDDNRGQQPAVLQRHQRRLHPPPFLPLDGPSPDPPPIAHCVVTHGLVVPLVMKKLSRLQQRNAAAHARSRPTPPRRGSVRPARSDAGTSASAASGTTNEFASSFSLGAPAGSVLVGSICTDLRGAGCRGQFLPNFFSTARYTARNVVIPRPLWRRRTSEHGRLCECEEAIEEECDFTERG